MTHSTYTPNDHLARRNVWVLIAAQALLGAQLPMVFTIAGLAGLSLTANPCWATVPITLMVFGSMIWAQPLSALMQRYGRTVGFMCGAMMGALGAACGAFGLYYGSFLIFCLGGFLTGGYVSAQGFFRFAATDLASDNFRPKAISWVMTGGLLSALFGPQLIKLSYDFYVIPYLGSYLIIIIMNLVGSLLFLALHNPPSVTAQNHTFETGRSRWELITTPNIAVAMICATVSYALMNLIMTSSPLAVVGCGYSNADAANVVSGHVLAMYAPSFITGHIIARIGAQRTITLGLFLLTCAGAVALTGIELEKFFIALILLGAGWNFGFIGATALLTACHTPAERAKIQGLNDFIVFGGVSLASLASGGLMNCSGSSVQYGWSAVNLAMLPFLILAGGSLIWLALRPKETR